MNRLKYLFAAFLLLLALPFWRFSDFVAILSPFTILTSFSLTLWFAIFLAIPSKLVFPRLRTPWLVLAILIFAGISYSVGPLSRMATTDPAFNHCSEVTYTGFFYPLRNLLPDAHRDDLEARNQLCWVKKMISKVPKRFDSEAEVDTYGRLIQDKLLRPEIKYRVSLPFIALLYAQINLASESPFGVKKTYDSLHFWIDHYTEEISHRDYGLWSWPFSEYVKWEYGLVERNWQDLIDSITIEEQ